MMKGLLPKTTKILKNKSARKISKPLVMDRAPEVKYI
jgi:hypothetical protein